MRNIYSGTSWVVLWLGVDEDNEAPAAAALLEDIHARRLVPPNLDRLVPLENNFKGRELPGLNSSQ